MQPRNLHTQWNEGLMLVYREGNVSARLIFPEHFSSFFYIHKREIQATNAFEFPHR